MDAPNEIAHPRVVGFLRGDGNGIVAGLLRGIQTKQLLAQNADLLQVVSPQQEHTAGQTLVDGIPLIVHFSADTFHSDAGMSGRTA